MALSARIRFGATRSSTVPSYTRGETVEIWCDFRDEDGALVDVSGVTVTAYWPGGSERTPTLTPTEETAGTWTVEIPATLYDGLWKVVFACASPSAATDGAWFAVRSASPDDGPAPAAAPVTSVAGRNGAVTLTAPDIGYTPEGGAAETTLFAITRKWESGQLRDFGLDDPDGATDLEDLVENAITGCLNEGMPLIVGPGNRRFGGPITLLSGLRMLCDPKADFRAYFGTTQNHFLVGVPSVAGALDPATRQRGIYLEGGTWGLDGQFDGDGVWTSNRTCTVFNVFADDLRLNKVEVNGFGQGRAFQLCGDRVIGTGCNTFNPVRTGGAGSVRYIGGTYFRWSDSHSEAGDDVFMLVPGGTVSGVNWNNRTIEDAQYVNCTYKSWTARGMVVGLEGTSAAMTASIRRWAYIGVRGVGGGSSCSIQNRDSSGEIADGSFIGCSVDDSDNEDRPSAINITGWRMPGQTSGGGVRNIRFYGLDIVDCHRLALDISGYVDGVYFYGGTWAQARETGLQAVRVRGAHGGGLYNVVINGEGTVQPMVFGAEDALSAGPGVAEGDETAENSFQIRRSVENFRIRDCDIRHVPDDTHAVQVTYTDDLQITGNKVRKLDGATTARAVNFAATAENCLVEYNDFGECGHATPVSDVGTNNTVGANIGVAAASDAETLDTQSAAGGSLAWEPGLTVIRINAAGTVSSITGTPTYPAELVLRAVHSSGTLIIDHIANVIRLKGLVDLTMAINDALTLRYDTVNGYWFEAGRSVA